MRTLEGIADRLRLAVCAAIATICGRDSKRWSAGFAVAVAVSLGILPGIAQANFTLQYTGAPFNTDTGDCFMNPQCLSGRIELTFAVEGNVPTETPVTTCLALVMIGQPKPGCFTVDSGTVTVTGPNGVSYPLNDMTILSSKEASLTFSPSLNFWFININIGAASLNVSK